MTRTPTTSPPRGGRRPGAGRPARASTAAQDRVTVRLSPEERGELEAGLRAGETVSDLLRAGGLALVRGRRP